jgi:hypothetical protein
MKSIHLATLILLASTAHAGCNADPSDYRSPVNMGAPGPLKMFHVKGRHQCQSRQNIGYWSDVELRDATDCTAGHSRLQMQNPCQFYNGQRQDGSMSIGYYPGSCSPLW